MLQLYINDELADLADDTPVALTFQINNLAEVKNQQGNTSNQFKLPLTQRNRRILGFPDDIAFNTGQLYKRYDAKIIQDGLEIIPHGKAELNSVDKDSAAITVISGNVDFFDALGGKIYEMGDSLSQWTDYGKKLLWKQYDHAWDLMTVANSQKKTEGWIYPVVDYGLVSDDFTQPLNVRHMRPGFFIKTAIDILVRSTGYKAKGSLIDDPLYPLLICQFSNSTWEHGNDYQNNEDLLGINVSVAQNLHVSHIPIHDNKGIIYFNQVNADKSHQYSGSSVFKAKEPMNVNISLKIPQLLFNGKIAGNHPSYLVFFIRAFRGNNYEDLNTVRFDFSQGWVREGNTNGGSLRGTSDYRKVVVSAETQLEPGDRIRIDYEFVGDRPAFFTLMAGASLTIAQQNRTVKFGQEIQCERILPDLSQKDFLKDTLQRFGIICQTDGTNKTVTFSGLRDIVANIPIAKNWTEKCIDQGRQINFQLGNYAQVNNMQFKEDDAIPAKFGWSQINVADATLAPAAEMLVSPFAPTLNRVYTGGSIAQIKMADIENGDEDFSIDVAPRILVDEKRFIPFDRPVAFTDSSSTITIKGDYISTPYFYKPEGDYNLCFCDMPGASGKLPGLKTKYYAHLEKILQQTKKVVRYFLLTPRDILELDLLIPVYLEQDSAYYYINKIDSWRKGQPTKVELIRL